MNRFEASGTPEGAPASTLRPRAGIRLASGPPSLLLPLLLCLAAPSLGAAGPDSAAHASLDDPSVAAADTMGTVEGWTRIQLDGSPLPGVRVSLHREGDEGFRSRTTDDDGIFRFTDVRPGEYWLRFEYMGFKEVERSFRLTSGDDLQVEVNMALEVLELDAVVVMARAEPQLQAVGFDRRRLLGLGHFLTAEEIERRGVNRVSDLFRSLPGFGVQQHHRFPGSLSLVGRGGCEPTLYVNGGRTVTTQDIDSFLQIYDLAGVEAYPGALSPAAYPGGRCGTVLAWTDAAPSESRGGAGGEGTVDWRGWTFGIGLALYMAVQIF